MAALAEPTLELVPEELLEPALADGVLVLEGDRFRFAHPLLATVAYRRLGPRARRALHRRLAELVQEPEQRARHLALGAEGRDPALAATLDAAAAHARARGAPEAAAELAEHAIAQTPAANRHEAARRRANAAEYAMLAGEDRRARALLEQGARRRPRRPGARPGAAGAGDDRRKLGRPAGDRHSPRGARAFARRRRARGRAQRAAGDDVVQRPPGGRAVRALGGRGRGTHRRSGPARRRAVLARDNRVPARARSPVRPLGSGARARRAVRSDAD